MNSRALCIVWYDFWNLQKFGGIGLEARLINSNLGLLEVLMIIGRLPISIAMLWWLHSSSLLFGGGCAAAGNTATLCGKFKRAKAMNRSRRQLN